MENKNYDLKLAGYIWSILKTQPVIVMSWGVDMDTIKPVKVQSPNQKIPDRKTKCVIKTHINIKQNVIFSAKLKPV